MLRLRLYKREVLATDWSPQDETETVRHTPRTRVQGFRHSHVGNQRKPPKASELIFAHSAFLSAAACSFRGDTEHLHATFITFSSYRLEADSLQVVDP